MTSSETHFSKAFAATDLCRDIETLLPELVTIRHTLHQHPEKGTQEFETDRIITGCLDAWGIPYRMIADTGILASLTGEGSDPVGNTVGLRADIDALPIEEDPSHACCSLNSGMMHACGHDAHTTIALGTARLLQLHRSEWSGTVKFFFQPAEETVGGAQRMVEQGCMKDPDVDYVAGLHVMPQFHTGELEMKYGKLNAASDEVLIDLHRDGVAEGKRLVTQINGKDTAKIMFFNGISHTISQGAVEYLPNPYIEDNLAFSFQLEYQAALYYPSFYRGIYLAGLRYNLHLRPKSLLVEAGAQTNTVQEVKNAMEPLADILNRVLNPFSNPL